MGSSHYCNKIKNLLNMFEIKQVVEDYTRCTDISSTLFDYVLINYDGITATVHSVRKITAQSVISVVVHGPEWFSPYNVKSKFTELKLLELNNLSRIVSGLKNKRGSEFMDVKFIKSTFGVIGNHLIKSSLEYGIFPDQLKTSIVVPIQKVANSKYSWEYKAHQYFA
ncbi:hypothetical protein HHI36_002692, partial [Cryptolaemus montrouzieri]